MDESNTIKWLGIAFGVVILAIIIISIVTADRSITVTYDLGYEDRLETETVDKGLLESSKVPFRFGYTFEGWYYVDKNGEEVLWDFSTDKIKRDVTLYAKWLPKTYTLTLMPNGGECAVETIAVACGESYALPEVTREGYYFAGWYLFGEVLPEKGTWKEQQDCLAQARWTPYPPGMTVEMGVYEQDNNLLNGKEPIEWLVIDYRDGQYLLLSKYVLDAIPMISDNKEIYYRDCSLRRWLGETFLYEAFTDEERTFLVPTYLDDVDLTETVFLLNVDEAKKLLYSKGMGYGLGTDYALAQGLENNCSDGSLKHSFWWTRHARDRYSYASWAMSGNMNVALNMYYGVRPAVWLDESALTDGVARVK